MASSIFIRQSYAYFKNKKRKSRNFFSSLANRRFLLTEFATVQNKKSSPFGLLLLGTENETRARAARGRFARELCLHPRPLEGVSGVASDESSCQTKKAARLDCFFVLSGKRDSNSRPQPWQGCALPTELFPQICERQNS